MVLPALKEIIDERKEKAVETLSASYAKNRLPLEEYERLVEYVNKIESERELVIVEKIVAEYNTGDGPSAAHEDDDYGDEPGYPQEHYGRHNLTILSSRTFSGPLKNGSQFVSILGSEHIKIRKADLKKRRTRLRVASILEDTVVFVENGIRVINATIPVLGGSWMDPNVGREAHDGAPELVIAGAALLGNVTVRLLKE